ncbi:MAG: dephospho-CoA kinase [Treponema sp.]|jgi:dephospho-CoA kinase|nr:dephospho-CoA kinase [Treponema sp.]
MLIGLTGTYCAGKNHVAALLEARGLPVLDVDKLGYKVLETEKETIFVQFGRDLQKADGSLDRRLLGQRVFGKPEKLAALEAIVHPAANRLTAEWVADRERAGDRACVINAALLHRSVVFNRLDRIILVTAPFFTRLIRAKRRDRLSWTEILKRFARQKDFNSQYLSIKAEIYRIENPGLTGSGNLRKKLECRLDKFIEGMN